VIATGECYTVKDFLEVAFGLVDLDYKKYVEIDARLFRPHEVPFLQGDSSKAQRVLGWKPKVSFQELVKLMYQSDLKNEMKANK
jgi:GDPmannose 4,6-dehydratase